MRGFDGRANRPFDTDWQRVLRQFIGTGCRSILPSSVNKTCHVSVPRLEAASDSPHNRTDCFGVTGHAFAKYDTRRGKRSQREHPTEVPTYLRSQLETKVREGLQFGIMSIVDGLSGGTESTHNQWASYVGVHDTLVYQRQQP